MTTEQFSNGFPVLPPVSAGGGSGLIYSPLNPAPDPANGIYDIWADLVAALPESGGVISIDDTFQSPAKIPAGKWYLKSSRIQSRYLDVGVTVKLECQDKSILTDVREFRELIEFSSISSIDCLVFQATAPLLIVSRGASLRTNAAPLINVASFFIIAAIEGGNIGDGILPVVAASPGSSVQATSITNAEFSDNWILGDFTASLGWSHDDTSNTFSIPGFLGTVSTQLDSNSLFESYDDTLVLPPLGASNVQDAIDVLKSTSAGFVGVCTFGMLSYLRSNPSDENWLWHGGSTLTAASPFALDVAGAFPVPSPGVIRRWVVKQTLPSTEDVDYRLYVNGVFTGSLIIVLAGTLSGSDVTPIPVAPGDTIQVTVECGNGPFPIIYTVYGVAAVEIS